MNETTEKAIRPRRTVKNEFYEIETFSKYNQLTSSLHARYIPDDRILFAKDIVARFALISAKPNGEDSAGRAKAIREDPKALVTFACDVAASAYEEFKARGWLVEMPSVDEQHDMGRENSDRN